MTVCSLSSCRILAPDHPHPRPELRTVADPTSPPPGADSPPQAPTEKEGDTAGSEGLESPATPYGAPGGVGAGASPLPVCLFPAPWGHSEERAAWQWPLAERWQGGTLTVRHPVWAVSHQVSSSLGIGEFPKTSDPETEHFGQAPVPRLSPSFSHHSPSLRSAKVSVL